MMTYKEALSYIHSTDWRGSRPGLSRITELCTKLGDPQDRLKFVHVAGTNGKGSVSSMTSRILRAAGYSTGLFTSPYVERFNERIILNGRPITDADLAEATETVREAACTMEDGPTEFELITAIGLVYYARKKCDIVVWECGLGGRLDSTNVIRTPAVSVITGIALDHTQLLGSTTAEIAREKAGIIKPGVPVIYGEVDRRAEEVILAEASEKHSVTRHVDYGSLVYAGMANGKTRFTYKGKKYTVGFPAVYQTRNAACVLETVCALRELGYDIPEKALRKGLRDAKWKARFETLSEDPLVIYDGSHNPQGMAACCESIEKVLVGKSPDGRIDILMGVMADKDYRKMIDLVSKYAAKAFAVSPGTPRSMTPEKLAAELGRKIENVKACPSLAGGVAEAVREAEEDKRPLVCLGTLYMYADVKKAVRSALKEKTE